MKKPTPKSSKNSIIKVFVVDDHDLIGIGIKQLFSKTENVKLAGFANSGKEALEKFQLLKPDITILDVYLPDINGSDLIKKIKKNNPSAKIIIHSAYVESNTVVKCFKNGAMGYVPKDSKPKDLLEAIYTVSQGSHYSKGKVSDLLINNYLRNKGKKNILTKRETDITIAVCKGFTNQKIAEQYNISVRTVEAHKANLMNKLKVKNTAELVVYAIKNNIYKIDN